MILQYGISHRAEYVICNKLDGCTAIERSTYLVLAAAYGRFDEALRWNATRSAFYGW